MPESIRRARLGRRRFRMHHDQSEARRRVETGDRIMLILLEDEDVARDIPKELIHSGVIEMPVIEPIDFTKPNLPFPPEPTKTKLYRYKFPRKYELVLSEDVNHK